MSKIAKTCVALVLAMMLLCSAACAEKITFWNWWSPAEDAHLQEVLVKFTEETGIEVETMMIKDMAQIMSAIAGGTPPDVCMLTTRNQLVELASNGAAMALDEYMARDGVSFDDFLPNVKAAYTENGQVYGFPFLGFNFGLFYNKDAFSEAGLDPETPPKTAEELVEYAKRLTKVNEDGTIERLGIAVNGGFWFLTERICRIFGGDYYDEQAQRFTLNDPAVLKAIEWMRSLYAEAGVEPQAAVDFLASCGMALTAEGPFESGRVAMNLDGCYVVAFNAMNVPDLNYGVCPMPVSQDHPEMTGANVLEYNPHFIPTGSAHPEQAWQLLKYLCCDKQVVAEFADFCANINHLNDLPEGYDSDLQNDPRYRTFIDLSHSENAVSCLIYPNLQECNAKITTAVDSLLLDPSLDAAATLSALNAELNALIGA